MNRMSYSSDGSNLALGYLAQVNVPQGNVELWTSSNYLDGTAYTEDSSSDITISADALKALLDTNVNVTTKEETEMASVADQEGESKLTDQDYARQRTRKKFGGMSMYKGNGALNSKKKKRKTGKMNPHNLVISAPILAEF
mgnify:CR=1 FL=1